jgi:hypothetical protein
MEIDDNDDFNYEANDEMVDNQHDILFYNKCDKYPYAFGCPQSSKVPKMMAYKDSVSNFVDNACSWGLLGKECCSNFNYNVNKGLLNNPNTYRKIAENEYEEEEEKPTKTLEMAPYNPEIITKYEKDEPTNKETGMVPYTQKNEQKEEPKQNNNEVEPEANQEKILNKIEAATNLQTMQYI